MIKLWTHSNKCAGAVSRELEKYFWTRHLFTIRRDRLVFNRKIARVRRAAVALKIQPVWAVTVRRIYSQPEKDMQSVKILLLPFAQNILSKLTLKFGLMDLEGKKKMPFCWFLGSVNFT